ncbi:MAG TPA: hypothetical protein VGF73_11380, partial [Chthoniobacterales bacterium]
MRTGRWIFLAFWLSLGRLPAEIQTPALRSALEPMTEGVPQVSIERLRLFLATDPPLAEQTEAQAKLIEALARAGHPTEALEISPNAAGLTNNPDATFWRAQALAALARWSEALPLYEKVATGPKSLLRADALFGEAEALRALKRENEAIQVLRGLAETPQWATRANLGVAQLLIDRGDLTAADHLLRSTRAQLATERSERRFLFGRLSLAQGHPERVIETLGVILKRPEGVSHSLLVATLFTLAEAHQRMHTPEAG